MSRTVKNKIDDSSRKWNLAIAEAGQMLARATGAKAERLKAHIAWMEQSRDAGEKWGDQPIKKPTIASGLSAGACRNPAESQQVVFPARL